MLSRRMASAPLARASSSSWGVRTSTCYALGRPAPGKCAGKDRGNAAAEGDVIVLDEKAGGEIDAVIGAAAAEHRVFLEGPHAGHGFARIEHAGVGALNRVGVFARERGDAAEVLQQIENHALRN